MAAPATPVAQQFRWVSDRYPVDFIPAGPGDLHSWGLVGATAPGYFVLQWTRGTVGDYDWYAGLYTSGPSGPVLIDTVLVAAGWLYPPSDGIKTSGTGDGVLVAQVGYDMIFAVYSSSGSTLTASYFDATSYLSTSGEFDPDDGLIYPTVYISAYPSQDGSQLIVAGPQPVWRPDDMRAMAFGVPGFSYLWTAEVTTPGGEDWFHSLAGSPGPNRWLTTSTDYASFTVRLVNSSGTVLDSLTTADPDGVFTDTLSQIPFSAWQPCGDNRTLFVARIDDYPTSYTVRSRLLSTTGDALSWATDWRDDAFGVSTFADRPDFSTWDGQVFLSPMSWTTDGKKGAWWNPATNSPLVLGTGTVPAMAQVPGLVPPGAAAVGFSESVWHNNEGLAAWGTELYYPLRMSHRNDTYGVVQQTVRMNDVTGSRSSSSYTSNRVFGTGGSSYI